VRGVTQHARASVFVASASAALKCFEIENLDATTLYLDDAGFLARP
jgi:hypothetical protein